MSTALKTTTTVVTTNFAEREAAEYLNVSVHLLRRWRVYGGGPKYLKMGSRCLYPLRELEAFQEACLRKNTSDPGPSAGCSPQKRGQGGQR